jgi:hypothetical protein
MKNTDTDRSIASGVERITCDSKDCKNKKSGSVKLGAIRALGGLIRSGGKEVHCTCKKRT